MSLAVSKHVRDAFSTLADLSAAPREDIGFAILEVVASATNVREFSSRQFCREEGNEYGAGDEPALHIMSAWMWLVREGLLIPNPQHVISGDDCAISPEGRKLLDPDRFKAYRQASQLPRELIHTLVLDAAISEYSRGRYDMAVFAAMRCVEIELRAAGRLDASLHGADLARAALTPKRGVLRDVLAPDKEQAAICELFVSAFGAIRNPPGHRAIEYSNAVEVAQILIFSSYLLSVIDRLRST